ncbi:MAG TPA: DUF3786 domain-containing protein [Methylomusa anaerophila]|uniref:DUF3786 domain-containing protein n=1 Tax=Methylomusa anaerophila TaxID=1930071 RepID=A0A348AK46_9FIRM|nr:DUF3786 domain-containing protein [Methylomusa anaerophila]BBB91444.1 hypothetical protein MAMMFC1_02128 [Methylomusa anaerophila]HML90135.1 DUF3786 domain-containing protein [Methylomusa anaerophila]
MGSGYEQIYEGLIPKLSKCDFFEIAERLGLSLQPDGTLSVQFLGREYGISSHGINPTDGKSVNVNNRSVLAYYTLSQGMGEPEFSYVPISYHTGPGITFSSNIKWMTDPLGKAFSENYEAFRETMGKLGGVFNGKMKSGGYSWLLNVLPKIPLQIIYQDGDDEFPCEVQILFDKNASLFLEFECLAFLEGCLVRAMLMTARTGDTTGWV